MILDPNSISRTEKGVDGSSNNAFGISLSDAKTHLRVTSTSEDSYITTLIEVACESVEKYLKKSLGSTTNPSTYVATYSAFPVVHNMTDIAYRHLRIPFPPLKEITSVEYYDTANVKQTVPTNQYFAEDNAESYAILTFND